MASRKSKNHLAVVTGAASGIGLATTRRFAEAGFRVAAIDRSEKGLEQLRRRKWASCVHAFVCDLGDVAATGQTAQKILKEQGPVRTLVNNAGIWYYTPIEETPDEYWQHTLNVNLVSAAALVRAFVPGMKAIEGAAIVNTSSRNALSSSPNASTYDASKAALLGFTRTMAVELGPYGIRANAVCPGVIDTPANKAEIADPQFVENYLRLIPLNRFGKPEDMANVIYFLASEEAAFVTGQHIVADNLRKSNHAGGHGSSRWVAISRRSLYREKSARLSPLLLIRHDHVVFRCALENFDDQPVRVLQIGALRNCLAVPNHFHGRIQERISKSGHVLIKRVDVLYLVGDVG